MHDSSRSPAHPLRAERVAPKAFWRRVGHASARLFRRPDIWRLALLLALPFALFWPVWWPHAAAKQTFAFGDFVEQYYPMRAFVAGEWRAARLPLWDPYTYAGTPAAAASLFAAFYPGGLWLALFKHPFPFIALELEALIHLGLGGVFTLLFVRRATGHLNAGLLAGLAFSLGGFLTSYPLLQLGILETAIWLPAGLWLIEGGLVARDTRRTALAGAAFAYALLAGHPQTFLYIVYLATAYFIHRAIALRLHWRTAVRHAVLLGGLTIALSAVQWLPSLELTPLSPRAALSYEAVSNGFQVRELWGLLRPNRGEWSPLYIGWIPLALAVVGLVRRRAAWFWGAVAVVALFLALGRNGFLYPLVYSVVPGFASFRNQERAAFLVSFALAVSAGYGFAALTTSPFWTALGRHSRRKTNLIVLAFVALTGVDLGRAGYGLALTTPLANGYFPATALTEHLRITGSPDWRVSSEGLLPGDGNAGQVYHVRDVTGNSPLHIAQYDRFLVTIPEARLWQLLNVQHVVTQRRLQHGGALEVLEDDARRLYQIFGARPTWIVHDYHLVGSPEAALISTAEETLDPLATAIVEEPPAIAPTAAHGEETAQLVHFSPQRIAIVAQLDAPGLLISSEVAYPGWNAYVNGRQTTSMRAYGLLRAVALPAGVSQVEWRYQPLSVYAGLILSLLGLGVTVGLLIRGLHRKRQDSKSNG